jgi:hypothetical protein
MKVKELIVVAAIGLFASCDTPYEATDTTVVVAPDVVTTSFTTQYPTATRVAWTYYDPAVGVPLEWDMTGWTILDTDDYVARFTMDNEDYYAWYDKEGNWIGSAYVLKDPQAMPTAVLNTINSQFSGYTISSVTREFMAGDRVAYEVELKNNHSKLKVLLDSNGNILKQKDKSVDD